MKQTKVLLVSPCQGTYGGIEAFVLAVADAVRGEPGFILRVCFKKGKGFALNPSLAAMLLHGSVMFLDRVGGQLADVIEWGGVLDFQNAFPDGGLSCKF